MNYSEHIESSCPFHCFSNQFSQKVAEQYLSYFDFSSLVLVDAMRKFFSHFTLIGETQERERVLFHLTNRYISCNPSVLDAYFMSEGV